MPQATRLLPVLICCALFYGSSGFFREDVVAAHSLPQLVFHGARMAETDLEVRGLGNSIARFVSRESLETLPQVEALVKRDENFTEVPQGGIKVRGVPFELLEGRLGAAPGISVEAVCADGYTPAFPAEYVKEHHPIFVLSIEGLTPKAWAEKRHMADLGPYFVAYDSFVPAFHVLSHEDRPQVPVQLVRLNFAPERLMFAGISPGEAADADVTDGYKIAQQNCFRCHAAGGHGGTVSDKTWQALAKDARERPEWFAKWVHDPTSVDAKATMPPNPKYNRATLTALSKYFSTMR